MAKSNANSGGASVLEEEAADLYRPPASRSTDGRTTADPDDGAGEPFLRARRRVPVRRGLLPAWARSGWGRLAFGAVVLAALGLIAALILATRSFLDHDPRFRIESAASIQTLGNSQLSRAELLSVFGSDIGRNLFFVPLAQRRAELEQIPWVRHATVMRVLPNQLRAAIQERTPIAFVEVHGRIELADADGVILTMTPQQMAARHYSFPVVRGVNPADPPAIRAARMQMYQRFVAELDATSEHISAQLSEVDLSDPDDVRATVPSNRSDLLLHFGQEDFLARWRNYQAHVAQWEQQYPRLASIDLRYEHEVVLKMAGDPGASLGERTEAKPATKPAAKPDRAEAQPAHATAAVAHNAKAPARKPPAAKHTAQSHVPGKNPQGKGQESPAKPHAARSVDQSANQGAA